MRIPALLVISHTILGQANSFPLGRQWYSSPDGAPFAANRAAVMPIKILAFLNGPPVIFATHRS